MSSGGAYGSVPHCVCELCLQIKLPPLVSDDKTRKSGSSGKGCTALEVFTYLLFCRDASRRESSLPLLQSLSLNCLQGGGACMRGDAAC